MIHNYPRCLQCVPKPNRCRDFEYHDSNDAISLFESSMQEAKKHNFKRHIDCNSKKEKHIQCNGCMGSVK